MREKMLKPPPNLTGQPFERFERLAKALIAVPKKEIDKEIAKHERKKQKRMKMLDFELAWLYGVTTKALNPSRETQCRTLS